MRLRGPGPSSSGVMRRPAPVAVLGFEHPLVRDLDWHAVVARQSLAIGVILIGSAVAAVGGIGRAWALAISAAAVLLGLAAVAALLHGRERAHALQLILEGRERLPIVIVEQERRRLVDASTRRRLADSLDDIVRTAAAPRRRQPRPAPPIFHDRVVAEVADDLGRVAALLRSQPAGARGVALAEWLLTQGRSPLHGKDAAALREELRRVQFLLTT
jgi:hypothetical protein